MFRKKHVIVAGVALVLVIGWALFRPELLFIDNEVNEEFPSARAAQTSSPGRHMALVQGSFHGVAHAAQGKAAVYQLDGGQRVLRFTGFETSNGPALRVYLVAAGDASDHSTVTSAGYIDLGPLKGNVGDQNYDIPADVDLGKYRAATIWCQRFSVNFATAPLRIVN